MGTRRAEQRRGWNQKGLLPPPASSPGLLGAGTGQAGAPWAGWRGQGGKEERSGDQAGTMLAPSQELGSGLRREEGRGEDAGWRRETKRGLREVEKVSPRGSAHTAPLSVSEPT